MDNSTSTTPVLSKHVIKTWYAYITNVLPRIEPISLYILSAIVNKAQSPQVVLTEANFLLISSTSSKPSKLILL